MNKPLKLLYHPPARESIAPEVFFLLSGGFAQVQNPQGGVEGRSPSTFNPQGWLRHPEDAIFAKQSLPCESK